MDTSLRFGQKLTIGISYKTFKILGTQREANFFQELVAKFKYISGISSIFKPNKNIQGFSNFTTKNIIFYDARTMMILSKPSLKKFWLHFRK